MYTEQITQRIGFATPIHPQVLNNSTLNTGAVDMAAFHRAFFAMDLGAITNGGSITATLQESSDLASWTSLSGSSVSMSAVTTASKLYTFECRSDQVTRRYLRLSVQETGGQNVNVCVLAWGDEAAHKPGSAQNAAAVSTQNVVG